MRTLVGRLDLEKYKATIKGLTQFGDRRQGTDRNRAAIDWIEAQLKSYGCTTTERIKYDYQPARARRRARRRVRGGESAGPAAGAGGAAKRREGHGARRLRAGGQARQAGAARRGARQYGINGNRGRPASTTIRSTSPTSRCASSTRSRRRPACAKQVYCTKIGTTRPDEMYIVGGHMDGIGLAKRPTTTVREPPW